MERVFLTGISGFVGGCLAGRLASDGIEVIAVCRKNSRLDALPRGCSVTEVDFLKPAGLAARMEGASAIFHLAGATAGGSQESFDIANAAFTRSLLAARDAAAPGAVFVHVSSQSASGPCGEGPISPYGRSKLLGELVVRRSGNWIIVRPPAVFGPGDKALAPVFRLANRGIFPYPLRRGTGFALIYVADLADLLARLPGCPDAREKVLEPSYGRIFTWGEFRGLLEKASGKGILPIPVPPPFAYAAAFISETIGAFSGSCPVFDRHKCREFLAAGWTAGTVPVKKATGWSPASNVVDALRETWMACCPPRDKATGK
jgi:nucleoside-diphosphate-sugar epimerase